MSNTKRAEPGAAEGARRATEQSPESAPLPGAGRWSAKRKTSVVLELLRGADLESTSRKHRVTAATLSEWRERFLAGGEAMLKSRENDAEDEEVKRLKSVVAASAWITNCCARRSRAWRTAALWHAGGRSHEPYYFAFQQKALWCGARSGAVEPGTF